MLENIQKALNPIGEQFQNFQQMSAKEKAQQDLERVMNEMDQSGKKLRPDFNEMVPVMIDLKKDPAREKLPLMELYDLAHSHYKRTQPEKYAALQDKYFPRPENMQQSYGGFLSATLQETGEPGDMPIADAAHAAAREVLENVGSLPGADELGDLPS
jgi:hypothetical protein